MPANFPYTGEVGCLVDSHLGRYAYPGIISIARAYGMPDTDPEDGARWEMRDQEPDSEYMIEWSDAAIDWLNENVAADDYAFGWEDGEFFYMPLEWWDE